MLVLSRKKLEVIRIGDNITVMVAGIRNNVVRIAIDAPREIAVHRQEVLDRIAAGEPLHRIEEQLDWRENR